MEKATIRERWGASVDLNTTRRVLIDSHQGIGDLAMMLPGVKALKETIPHAEFHFIVKSPVEASVVRAAGLASEFDYYDPLAEHHLADYAKLILALRRHRFDLGVSHIGINPRLGAALLKAAGCKTTVGASSKSAPIGFDIPVPIDEGVYRSKRNYQLFSAIGAPVREEHLRLFDNVSRVGWIDEEVEGKTLETGRKRFAAICVGSGSTAFVVDGRRVLINAKQWSIKKWEDLSGYLLDYGYGVLLFGGQKEVGDYGSDIARWRRVDEVVNLVGRCTMEESLYALSFCDIVVGADTGLLFCGALMGKHTFTLFGPSDERMALPDGVNSHGISLHLQCSPCYGTDEMLKCTHRSCLANLEVSDVVDSFVSYGLL